MTIDFNDVNEQLRHIKLTGLLDIPGTDAVSTKFTALSVADKKGVVVDLSDVDFLASIGIRLLISSAKALQQRGGHMALYIGKNEVVAKTINAINIDSLLPTFTSADDADQAVTA